MSSHLTGTMSFELDMQEEVVEGGIELAADICNREAR